MANQMAAQAADGRERLLEFQAAQGITWTELSKRLGYSVSYITRIASGERPAGDSLVGRFALTFGFEVAKRIFGDVETPELASQDEAA